MKKVRQSVKQQKENPTEQRIQSTMSSIEEYLVTKSPENFRKLKDFYYTLCPLFTQMYDEADFKFEGTDEEFCKYLVENYEYIVAYFQTEFYFDGRSKVCNLGINSLIVSDPEENVSYWNVPTFLEEYQTRKKATLENPLRIRRDSVKRFLEIISYLQISGYIYNDNLSKTWEAYTEKFIPYNQPLNFQQVKILAVEKLRKKLLALSNAILNNIDNDLQLKINLHDPKAMRDDIGYISIIDKSISYETHYIIAQNTHKKSNKIHRLGVLSPEKTHMSNRLIDFELQSNRHYIGMLEFEDEASKVDEYNDIETILNQIDQWAQSIVEIIYEKIDLILSFKQTENREIKEKIIKTFKDRLNFMVTEYVKNCDITFQKNQSLDNEFFDLQFRLESPVSFVKEKGIEIKKDYYVRVFTPRKNSDGISILITDSKTAINYPKTTTMEIVSDYFLPDSSDGEPQTESNPPLKVYIPASKPDDCEFYKYIYIDNVIDNYICSAYDASDTNYVFNNLKMPNNKMNSPSYIGYELTDRLELKTMHENKRKVDKYRIEMEKELKLLQQLNRLAYEQLFSQWQRNFNIEKIELFNEGIQRLIFEIILDFKKQISNFTY